MSNDIYPSDDGSVNQQKGFSHRPPRKTPDQHRLEWVSRNIVDPLQRSYRSESDRMTALRFSWLHMLTQQDKVSELKYRVLITLCQHINDKTGDAYPGLKRLAAICRTSKEKVSKIIADCESRGFLEVDRAGDGVSSSTYRLTFPHLRCLEGLSKSTTADPVDERGLSKSTIGVVKIDNRGLSRSTTKLLYSTPLRELLQKTPQLRWARPLRAVPALSLGPFRASALMVFLKV